VQPVARGKVQILKYALRFLKSIANLLWVASEFSNPQSLTHAAVDQSGYVHLAQQCCMVAYLCYKQLI